MRNTRVTYLYRDGGNYKTPGAVIVSGEVSPAQQARIRLTLSDGNFIAHQVGVPEVAPHLNGGEYDDEIDHCFHEFEGLEITADIATDCRSVEELVQSFEAAACMGWEVFDPAERSGYRVLLAA